VKRFFGITRKNLFTYSNVRGAVGVLAGLPSLVGGISAIYIAIDSKVSSGNVKEYINDNLRIFLYVYSLLMIASTLMTILMFSAYRRHRINSIALEKYRKCETEFGVLGKENAQSDKKIFELLFNQLINNRITVIAARNAALKEIDNNIVSILNSTCEIMKHITGHHCAACVKLLFWRDNKSGDVQNAMLKTMLRDKSSENRRGKREHVYGINDNTANQIVILSNGVKHFISNDLKNERNYHTTSVDYQNYYNAAVVVGIPRLQSESNIVKIHGLLCVDNMEGDFDELVCPKYLEEIAWRLSVLLYRNGVLALPITSEIEYAEIPK
jgi:uncharacterized HAD superfamily protein